VNRRSFFKLTGGAAALGAVSQVTPLGLWSKIAKWFEPNDWRTINVAPRESIGKWVTYRYKMTASIRPDVSQRLRFVSPENLKPGMVVRPPRREYTPGYRTYIMAKEGILS
jgi:hypothetical protein